MRRIGSRRADEATLFIWDNDGDFVYWTGAANENWMDPDNWDGLAVPGAGDTVVFNGSFTNDVELAGPLSPYAIGGLIVASGYTGTITLAFPLQVGDFQMAAGTIDQPSSAYGSDLTITGAAVWTGGVLNSTSNVANIAFDGASVIIAPANSGAVQLGSNLALDNTAAGTMGAGTIELSNGGIQFATANGSSFAIAPGAMAQTIIDALGPPANGLIEAGTSWTLYSGQFVFPGSIGNAGTVTLMPNTTFIAVGNTSSGEGYVQWGANSATNLLGGSTLSSVEDIIIQGGSFSTIWSDVGNSASATILGDMVVSGGHIYVGSQQEIHVSFGELLVAGTIDWAGGTFHPYVQRGGNNDVWRNTLGQFTLTGGVIAPIYIDSDYGTSSSPEFGDRWQTLKSSVGFTNATAPSVDNSSLWEMELDPAAPAVFWDLIAL